MTYISKKAIKQKRKRKVEEGKGYILNIQFPGIEAAVDKKTDHYFIYP